MPQVRIGASEGIEHAAQGGQDQTTEDVSELYAHMVHGGGSGRMVQEETII